MTAIDTESKLSTPFSLQGPKQSDFLNRVKHMKQDRDQPIAPKYNEYNQFDPKVIQLNSSRSLRKLKKVSA